MDNSSLNKKVDQRIKLTLNQTLFHYSFMLVPLFVIAYEFYYKLSGNTIVNEFSGTAKLVLIVLSLIIGYLKWRELLYSQLNVKRTTKQFEKAVLASANKMNWNITNFENNIVEATASRKWIRGILKIIIRRESDSVLINSRTDSRLISPPDLFGANKTHTSTFLHYYQISNTVKDLKENVIKDVNDEEVQILKEPEWNFKNTLKRLIAYLFSLGFLGIGLATWHYDGFSFYALLFSALGCSYVLLDIYVMWVKTK